MWGDPGVTELLQLIENPVVVPTLSGGQKSVSLSRAGYLKKLRFFNKAIIDVAAQTTAATKSPWGPLAAINNLSVKANGQIDLVNLSGYGAMVYDEIQNRDGSVLTRPLNISELGVSDSLKVAQFDATSVATVSANYPFEINFALPMNLSGQWQEIGLWMLQNQAIDVQVNVTFNPIYSSTATNEAAWSGGTGITATLNSGSQLEIERELYDIPNDPKNRPNLKWAHQVIEYKLPFTGSFSRFEIPRSGLLLRAVVINLDSSDNPVEYDDVTNMSWIYGANRTPIKRTGDKIVAEYLHDYNRQPPKGVLSLDFYKWGENGLKLVKDTQALSNLRLESTFSTTTTGTQRIILDRLYPVVVGQ